MRMSRLLGTYGMMVLAFGCAAIVQADIRRVPESYPTIQSAIDVSFAGDIVEVGPGIWAESINFGGRAITVRSATGPSTTVIDPVSGRCFTATGQETALARLEGFTLRGGSAQYGGGVYVSSSSPVIANCVITGNVATSVGGGVYVASGSLKLVGCAVSQNSGYSSGGGAYVGSGTLTLEGCVVSGNTLTWLGDTAGCGIYADSSSTLVLTGGSVSGNSARAAGGGILSYGQLSATGVTVSGNSATGSGARGGGINCQNHSPQLVNCTVSSNTSAGDGGGLWSSNYVSLSGCTVELNTAGGYGGAWYVSGGGPSLQSSQVRNNGATTVGGVWVAGGSVSVVGTLFCGNGVNINGAWADGGGNTFAGSCGGGGPTTRHVPSEYATIQSAIDASYDGDTVEVGPGTYAEGLNFGGREITVRSTAGAASTIVDPVSGRCFTATGQKGAAARLEGFTLRGGSAQYGGGVYVSSSSPVIANCVITGNVATSVGGGVYVSDSKLVLSNSKTSPNCALRANFLTVGASLNV